MTLRELPEKPGSDGVHLHANVVYLPPKLAGQRWQNWLEFARTYFKSHVKDCGRIKNLQEVVKYVTKPSTSPSEREKIPGLVGMCQLSAERLAWLHDATRRAHIFQPYQNFRNFRRGVALGKLKIYRAGTGKLMLVQKPKTEKEKSAKSAAVVKM